MHGKPEEGSAGRGRGGARATGAEGRKNDGRAKRGRERGAGSGGERRAAPVGWPGALAPLIPYAPELRSRAVRLNSHAPAILIYTH